jgi:hypothetical protein
MSMMSPGENERKKERTKREREGGERKVGYLMTYRENE